MHKAIEMAKINFRHQKIPYMVTAIVFACVGVDFVGNFLFGWGGADNIKVGIGNYLYLIALMAPIFIVAKNFRRIVNLGGKKKDFYVGCLINYTVFAAAISALTLFIHYTLDMFFLQGIGMVNLVEIFGWVQRGVIIAFLQQFAFLFLLQVFVHLLTSLQNSWVGWVADAFIVAIISVFTPIAALRALEVKFFKLIIWGSPVPQILSCLVIARRVTCCTALC